MRNKRVVVKTVGAVAVVLVVMGVYASGVVQTFMRSDEWTSGDVGDVTSAITRMLVSDTPAERAALEEHDAAQELLALDIDRGVGLVAERDEIGTLHEITAVASVPMASVNGGAWKRAAPPYDSLASRGPTSNARMSTSVGFRIEGIHLVERAGPTSLFVIKSAKEDRHALYAFTFDGPLIEQKWLTTPTPDQLQAWRTKRTWPQGW